MILESEVFVLFTEAVLFLWEKVARSELVK